MYEIELAFKMMWTVIYLAEPTTVARCWHTKNYRPNPRAEKLSVKKLSMQFNEVLNFYEYICIVYKTHAVHRNFDFKSQSNTYDSFRVVVYDFMNNVIMCSYNLTRIIHSQRITHNQ